MSGIKKIKFRANIYSFNGSDKENEDDENMSKKNIEKN